MQRSLIVVFFLYSVFILIEMIRKTFTTSININTYFFQFILMCGKDDLEECKMSGLWKNIQIWIYLRKLCTKIEWDCLLEILKNILLNKIPVHGDKGSSGYSVALACGKRRLNVAVPWMRPQNLRSLACDSQTCKGNWKLSRHLHRYEQIILKWDRNFTLRLNEIAF